MNWLDAVLILILVVSVLTSYRKGFSREVIGLAATIAGLLLGSWFYGSAGAFLRPYVSSPTVANFAGFFMVFFGVLILGAVLGFFIGKFLRVTGLSIFDHALGAGFGLVRGVLIAVALIMGIMAFSATGNAPDSVVHSRVAPYVAYAARVVSAIAPKELKDGFRHTYEEANSTWEKTWDKSIPGGSSGEKQKNEGKI